MNGLSNDRSNWGYRNEKAKPPTESHPLVAHRLLQLFLLEIDIRYGHLGPSRSIRSVTPDNMSYKQYANAVMPGTTSDMKDIIRSNPRLRWLVVPCWK